MLLIAGSSKTSVTDGALQHYCNAARWLGLIWFCKKCGKTPTIMKCYLNDCVMWRWSGYGLRQNQQSILLSQRGRLQQCCSTQWLVLIAHQWCSQNVQSSLSSRRRWEKARGLNQSAAREPECSETGNPTNYFFLRWNEKKTQIYRTVAFPSAIKLQ